MAAVAILWLMKTTGDSPMSRERITSKLLVGAIAGVVGTAVMSAAMRRLFAALPADEQYPMPPREVTERTFPGLSEPAERDATLLSHFGFGAAAGALVAAANADRRQSRSMLAALGIWVASYMGWAPGFGLLRPQTEHPLRRNLLMFLVHLVWGAATAGTAHELRAFRDQAIAGGPLKDAPGQPRKKP
jgi:hypothetical protein